ncbi:hypothetical protein CDL12_01101 [Handroanthus impetiginosus]|uniref:SPRY domain-containing protein n=1 Tax=Handroanthus impetiginosus TaxID=429701 RepID=A0A2G9I8R4_9LAMI|nr:hypothetical protein CDL12_01101 [Handroanthus impetiginosus]
MIDLLHITLMAAFAGILMLLLLLILQRFLHPKIRARVVISDIAEIGQNLQDGISMVYHLDKDGSKKTNNYYVFSWTDNPSLVTDAVENGWSRFAFTTFVSSSSVKSSRSLLGACTANDQENRVYDNVEISWEISEESEDYMQKIRLNPGLKKIITSLNSISVIRTALPLPGPNLGNSCFPQEAYFEITILEDIHDHKDEDTLEKSEKIKLIEEGFNAKINSVSEEVKFGGKWDEKNEGILVCVGLTRGGPLQLRIPGSFPGSIGFNSSGSVYLDGTMLVSESENYEWGTAENVIGCGYNPHQKKVFFTIDSQQIHEIHCKTEVFGTPLYPTIATNTDVTVLVNFGQSPFKFLPGNLQRIPNPCFVRHHPNSPVLGFEDSKELFSIGRIDWSNSRRNNNTVNSIKSIEFDRESESDLFEIALDRTRASPYASSSH